MKDKILKFVMDKNNWKIGCGVICLTLSAFLYAGVPALLFMAGLILVLSADD